MKNSRSLISAILIRVFPLLLTELLRATAAMAQSGGAAQAPTREVTLSEMFAFFFLMLGPIKILGPFVQMTRKCDAVFRSRLAFRACVVSCISLFFAALLGETALRRFRISIPVLAIAAGIILFLVALRTVLQQFDAEEVRPREYEPSLRLAVSPLSFPTIVTPYGIAAVIICMTLTPDLLTRGVVLGALVGLMLVNLVAMLFAGPILKYAAVPLQILGIVLGIIQVALGLQIIVNGLRTLAVLPRI